MTQTALQFKPKRTEKAGSDAGPIFLCHNSVDKAAVKQIADMLELEFGTSFFLDAYAIPTGEAFLPWIERSLNEASGAAIFLGANGWGPTHLWEAEKALSRYRAGPNFKLIPVALPGITAKDMRRLGTGKVFQEINWADFTRRLDDRDSLEKLSAALSGRQLPQHRGPARLTAYQIRRDAERWAKSDGKDKSILYRGAQLTDAGRLIHENPDFVVVDEVLPFLTASQDNQQRFWRRMAIGGMSIAVVLFGLTIAAVIGYGLAEQRRVASLSRQLAIASKEASGADRQLLISAQAVVTDQTTEAEGSLLQQLDEWRYLRRILHVGSSIEAAQIDAKSGSVVIGTSDGHLVRVDRNEAKSSKAWAPISGTGAVTAVTSDAGFTWVGRENGRVDVISGTGDVRTILPPPAAPPGKRDLGIRSLARQTAGTLLAAGTGSGRLRIVDTASGKIRLDLDEGEDIRIKALCFDADGRWLVVGTGNDSILFVDLRSFVVKQRYPKLEGGVLGLGFSKDGKLLAISANGLLTILHEKGGEFQRASSHDLPALLSSATVDAAGRRVAVGDASGTVYLYDDSGEKIGFESRRMHGNPVTAVAFGSDENTLISASADGTLAVWDLSGQSGPSKAIPAVGPDVSELRAASDGTLIAASAIQGHAGVWRLDSKDWRAEVDLSQATREALGPDAFKDADDQDPPAPGFVPMDADIPYVTLDGLGTRVAWSTKRGALLWRELGQSSAPTRVVTPADGRPRGDMAMSSDGRWLGSLDAGLTTLSVFDLAHTDSSPHMIGLPAPGRSLTFDAPRERIAVGLEDGRVALFRGQDEWRSLGQPTKVHDAPVAGIALTADGESLISFGSGGGGSDRTMAVTPVDDLTSVRRLQSRQAGGSVSVMSSGTQTKLLAAGDQDGQALIWSLSDLRFVAGLKTGTTNVSSILIDDTRKRMISTNSDGSFLSWDLDVGHWTQLACEKANRSLRLDEWAELLPDDSYQTTCPSLVSSPR
jgi:WD40 repeat protein